MYSSQVCTSNGTTYPNENDFNCAKLENKCKGFFHEEAQDNFFSLLTALKKIDCFDSAAKDECMEKRADALDQEFPYIVHACGSNNVTYVSKDDLLCAAKTIPGACI
jgi:hypothetical protein